MPKEFSRERSVLGTMLKGLRKAYGDVSQAELARRTQDEAERPVSAGHIAQIETGDRGASYRTLMTLGQALRLRSDDLDKLLTAGNVDPDRPDREKAELREVTVQMQAQVDEYRRIEVEAAQADRLEAVEASLQEVTEALRALARQVVEITDRYDAEIERQRRRRSRRSTPPDPS